MGGGGVERDFAYLGWHMGYYDEGEDESAYADGHSNTPQDEEEGSVRFHEDSLVSLVTEHDFFVVEHLGE